MRVCDNCHQPSGEGQQIKTVALVIGQDPADAAANLAAPTPTIGQIMPTDTVLPREWCEICLVALEVGDWSTLASRAPAPATPPARTRGKGKGTRGGRGAPAASDKPSTTDTDKEPANAFEAQAAASVTELSHEERLAAGMAGGDRDPSPVISDSDGDIDPADVIVDETA